jgi:sodium transport system permease protein
MSRPSLSLAGQLGRLARLARKELNESLRDRRTIITLVLMPLLLYPLLVIGFLQFIQLWVSGPAEKAPPVYRLGFLSEDEARSFLGYLHRGEEALRWRHAHRRADGGEPPADPPHLGPPPNLVALEAQDLEAEVRRGEVDVGVRLLPPGKFTVDVTRTLAVDCEVLYREDSARGRECVGHLERLCTEANERLLLTKLRRIGLPQPGDPVRVRATALAAPGPKQSPLPPGLVPLVLILMTMTGAVYPAIDLTAGERERRTLEALVAAPIPRLGVLFAKYVAVLTVAMLTALVNLGAMAITLYSTGVGKALFPGGLSPLAFAQVLGLLVLFAAFFSAVLLAVTSFARSFKEAQAYLIPLMLISLGPGMVALLPGFDLRGALAVVPLVNIVLLARDLFEGNARPGTALVVVLTTLVYAVAAVALAARVFGAEAVLSDQQSGWSDVFQRPRQARPAPEPAAALLCLAVMFPLYFVLTGVLGQQEGLSPGARLALPAAAGVLLFGGLPLAAAWLGHVRPAAAFRWRVAPWPAFGAALLLGVGLAPLVHELTALEYRFGISTLPPEVRERVRDFVGRWRELHPGAVVLALGVVPAVLEELFFRGYLFSALLKGAGRPWAAVVSSAALFALFHLVLGGVLAVERLLPSLLMGLVLGWLCWRSGSVLPGMVLHALHNGVLVLLGYYGPLLEERGWLAPGQEDLPAGLLLASALAAGLGLLWAWRLRPEAGREGEAPAEPSIPARPPGG